MPTINDITNGAGYRGDANLGNIGIGAIELDDKPIQQLAQYTYLYNKSNYDQRQKDADQKIQELAKLTAYDLANARGKDKQAGIDALTSLQKFGAEFAAQGTPKTPAEKINQQIEYQNKIQDAEKTINSINARGIGYTARKNAILLASNTDAALKDVQLKQLDEEFDNTDIHTPISAEPKFDLTVPKVAPPTYKNFDVITEGANGVVTQSIDIFAPQDNLSASYLEANNLDIPVLPPNATPQQKAEYQQKLTIKSNNKVWQDSAKILNTALADPKYKKEDGSIDYNAIESDNPILHNTLALIDRWNTYSNDHKADTDNGYYTDKVGNKLKLATNIKSSDWFVIDKTKPLSPAQVVFLEKFGTAAPDKKEEKYQYTGAADKIKIEQIQQAGQDRRNNADNAAAMARAQLPYIQAKIGSGTATKEEKSTYPVLKTQELVDIIGVDAAPKKFTDLTTEQQTKIKTQLGDKITDFTNTTVSITGGIINVNGVDETKKAVVVKINPDDITKTYYDEVNKNDAGKEAPERRYYKIETTAKETTPAVTDDTKLTDAEYFIKYKKGRTK